MENFFYGVWNGATAGILWWAHLVGLLEQFPIYHSARDGLAYQLGFLMAVSSNFSIVGTFTRRD